MRCIAIASFLLSFSASAQAQSAFEQWMDEGVRMRTERRDVEALHAFQQAYAIEPRPVVLAQIGLAEQALERWADAEAHLSEALTQVDDPWISANAETLGASLSVVRGHLGTLRVIGPEDAIALQVEVDERAAGSATTPMRLAVGRHHVRVLEPRDGGPARVRLEQDVTITPGGVLELAFSATSTSASSSARVPPTPLPSPEEAASEAVAPPAATPEASAADSNPRRPWGYLLGFEPDFDCP